VTVLLDMLAFGLAIPVLAFLYRELDPRRSTPLAW
jgi:hypothetical protein